MKVKLNINYLFPTELLIAYLFFLRNKFLQSTIKSLVKSQIGRKLNKRLCPKWTFFVYCEEFHFTS